MKQVAPTLTLGLLSAVLGCSQAPPKAPAAAAAPDANAKVTQATTLQDNALRVGLRSGLTDYFVYRGRPRGFEYDLAQRFARALDRRLSVRIIDDLSELETLYQANEIDLWIPAEPWRPTQPGWLPGPDYAHTDSVVVARRGETVKHVRTRGPSSALEDLTRWCAPPCTQQIVVSKSDWQLLVDLRKQPSGTGHAVAVNRRHGEAMTRLDHGFVIVHGMGKARPVRWWFNAAKPQLAQALKGFFHDRLAPRLRVALTARYFANPFQMRLRNRKSVRSDLAKRITRWDSDLKRAGSRFGVDWRLLAAVMMIESAQNPNATSSAGAQGLFQFMPKTAKAFGLDNPSDPKQASFAAARYLRNLMRRFASAASPYDQRMLALASYNAGQAHVDDARILARRMDLDAELWDDGVSLTLPLLANKEFFAEAKHGRCQGLIATRYAEQVSDLYEQYSQLLPQTLVDRDGGPGEP